MAVADETVTLEVALKNSATPGLAKLKADVESVGRTMTTTGRTARTALDPASVALDKMARASATAAAGTSRASSQIAGSMRTMKTASGSAASQIERDFGIIPAKAAAAGRSVQTGVVAPMRAAAGAANRAGQAAVQAFFSGLMEGFNANSDGFSNSIDQLFTSSSNRAAEATAGNTRAEPTAGSGDSGGASRLAGRVRSGFSTAAGVAGLGGAAGITGLLSMGIGRYSTIENTNLALQTLLGDQAKAKQFSDQLLAFAKQTPFAFTDIGENAKNLVAFGMDTAKVIPTLKAVGDAAAASGQGASGLNSIATALGKIQAQGRIMGDDVLALNAYGIPALQILANQAGLSASDMADAISAGSVDARTAIDQLVLGMQRGTTGLAGTTRGAAGLMEKLKGTWTGSVDTLKSSITSTMATLITPAMPYIQQGMSWIGAQFKKLPVLMSEVGQSTWWQGLVIGFQSVAAAASPVVSSIGAIPGPVKLAIAALAALILIGRRAGTALGSSMATFRQNLAMATYGQGPFARIYAGAMQARTALSAAATSGTGLSRVLAVAGASARVMGTGLAAAGRGFVGALGGVWGIGIMALFAGITLALNAMARAQAKAKAEAENHKRALEGLSDALGSANGDPTQASVRKQAWADLQGVTWGETNEWTGVGQLTELTGATQADMINARLGDPASVKRVTDQFQAAITQQEAVLSSMRTVTKGYNGSDQVVLADGYDDQMLKLQSMRQQVAAATGVIGTFTGAWVKLINDTAAENNPSAKMIGEADAQARVAAGTARDMSDAFQQMYREVAGSIDPVTGKIVAGLKEVDTALAAAMSAPPENKVLDAFAAIADSAAGAASQATAFRAALDRALGVDPEQESTEQAFWAAARKVPEIFKTAKEATPGGANSLVNNQGRIDPTSAAGGELFSSTQDVFKTFDENITAVWNHAGGMAGGQAALDEGLRAYRDASKVFLEGAAKEGVDPEIAQAMLDKQYGADGVNVRVMLEEGSAAAAAKDLQQVMSTAAKTAGDDVNAQLTAGAIAAMQWADGNVMNIPAELDADPAYAAYGGLRAFVTTTVMNAPMSVTTGSAYATIQAVRLAAERTMYATLVVNSTQASGATGGLGFTSAGNFKTKSGTQLKADGGRIIGSGTGTSDSIPAMLSNGEHVWTAAEVRAAGGHSRVESMRRAVLQGFANGGPVRTVPAPRGGGVTTARSVRIEKGAVQVNLVGSQLSPDDVAAAVEEAISRILAENDERRF